MDGHRARGSGLIELLIVLVLVVLGFFFLKGVYGKKGPGFEVPRYDKIYNDAKQQIEKIKAGK